MRSFLSINWFKSLILLTFIIPQVTFAAWWNPFSWFNNWSLSKVDIKKTEILEKRIEELEKRLASTTTPTNTAVTAVGTSTATTTKPQTQEKPKTTFATPPETKPTSQTNVTPKTFTTPNGTIIDEKGNVISGPTKLISETDKVISTQGTEMLSGEEIYSLLSQSVVQVIVSPGSGGTGFVIENGKYTLTNQHVVSDYSSVTLRFSDGRTLENAKVFGTNESADLAIIFNNGMGDLKSVKFGSSDPSVLRVGSDVFVLGYPINSFNSGVITLTKGVVSANKQIENGKNYVQTDATTHPGNSGGPLVNIKGEVVGVHTKRGEGTDTGGTGVALSVPIETAISLIPSLSNYGQNRIELYPIGSNYKINRSMIWKIENNRFLTCEQLLYRGDESKLCDLYRDYKTDYSWNIIEDFQR